MIHKGTVIIGGFIGILPAGGVTWDYIQYVLGFKKMGFEVIYLEDTRLYPIYQKADQKWNDSKPVINNLMQIMERFGLGNSWIYRDEVTGNSYGMDMKLFLAACKRADFFVNISCSTVMREEYAQIPNRILIDSDPMFTQIQLATEQSFTSETCNLKQLVNEHNYHFTFGENIKQKNCLIPDVGVDFIPTRQPVVLDYWDYSVAPLSGSYTTLMNWSAGKKLHFQGEAWGQKDMEFSKIKEIPSILANKTFDISVSKAGGGLTDDEKSKFNKNGWNLIETDRASGDEIQYQQFIHNSKAELSVAKHTYVKAKTGWFSCRSACYLASGRPVIAQDTGWSKYYTTGIGLFAFTNSEEAIGAIEKIESDLVNQSKAARQIAEAYFDSNKVINGLISAVSTSVL